MVRELALEEEGQEDMEGHRRLTATEAVRVGIALGDQEGGEDLMGLLDEEAMADHLVAVAAMADHLVAVVAMADHPPGG